MMKETFSEFIHKLRVKNNFTLTKLTAALDIDQSTLSKFENHKRNILKEALRKLAKLFKLDIKELEKEFISERIAVFEQDNTSEVLKLAEQKANYYKIKKTSQSKIEFI